MEDNDMEDSKHEESDLQISPVESDYFDATRIGAVDQIVDASWKKKLYIKIGYGIGEGGCYIPSSILGFFLSSYLLEVAQIPATLTGIIILLSECVDGFSDPIVGKLSDETRTKWGRRRPWIFCGAFPLCIFFLFLFIVPPIGVYELFVYYILISVIVKLSYASVAVPYTALTPEITIDYDQRTSLTMWRMIMGMIASVVATAGHAVLITTLPQSDDISDMRKAYIISITIWMLLAFVCLMITAITTRETMPTELLSSTRSFKKLIQESKDALLNREFLAVAVMYVSSWIALNFIQGNLFLWGKYVLKEEDLFSVYIFVIQGAAIVSLFGWKVVSSRIGKKSTSFIGVGILIVTCAGFGMLMAHQTIIAFILCILGGFGVGNMLLMPWSMLPDVMELDEIKCGYRREGVFYSWFVFFQKIGVGLGLGISSLWLGWVGYVPPDDQDEDEPQPESVIIALRVMMGLVPILLYIITAIAIYLFPITKISHSLAAQQVLDQRKDKLEKEIDSTDSSDLPDDEREVIHSPIEIELENLSARAPSTPEPEEDSEILHPQ